MTHLMYDKLKRKGASKFLVRIESLDTRFTAPVVLVILLFLLETQPWSPAGAPWASWVALRPLPRGKILLSAVEWSCFPFWIYHSNALFYWFFKSFSYSQKVTFLSSFQQKESIFCVELRVYSLLLDPLACFQSVLSWSSSWLQNAKIRGGTLGCPEIWRSLRQGECAHRHHATTTVRICFLSFYELTRFPLAINPISI